MHVTSSCPACSGAMRPDKDYERFATVVCRRCGHQMLDRKIEPSHPDDYVVADGHALRRMLETTRNKEFDLCIEAVRKHAGRGAWLDVGCSYGWFLKGIHGAGYDPFGIEPSATAFGVACGTFPGRVANGEFPLPSAPPGFPSRFDVLSAMDVLEHIPDPAPFLAAAAASLKPGGVLLLKVPSSDGVLFRLASAVSSRNRNGILGRLWQVDFNYPHWHYYCKRSLRLMLERHGFTVVAERSIPFAFLSTAHDRVRNYDGKPEPAASLLAKTVVAYVLILMSYVFRRFDNAVVIATPARTPAPSPASAPSTLPRD